MSIRAGLVALLVCTTCVLPAVAAPVETFTISVAKNNILKTVEGPILSLTELFWPKASSPLEDLAGQTVQFDRSKFASPNLNSNRYGDLRGQLSLQGKGWLQRYWIKRGEALWQGAGPYPAELRQELLKAEESARRNKKGIWQRQRVLDAEDLKVLSKQKGFQIVSGRIQSVRRVRGDTYLNFGGDWRRDFTAVISSKYKSKFKGTDWKPESLENKLVRVRGRLRSYNGPYMELYFPEQVEFLNPKAD
ncbi:MAG: thermonuclease family protein [Sneathiella sp.]